MGAGQNRTVWRGGFILEATSGRVGRGLKFGEPLIKREVRLPESLNTRLTEAARARKSDISDVMRLALDKELSLPNAIGTKSASGDGSRGLSERPDGTDSQDNLESTLRTVLSEVLIHSVPVAVDRVRRGRLEELAQKLGFTNERDLLQDLAFRALENPKGAESFLFSQLEQASVATVNAEESPRKTRKKAA